MSFFDEPEETRTAPPDGAAQAPADGGSARRPPTTGRQAIRVRRVGLAVVVVIVIVLILLVNSCQTSARNSALKGYNNSVASLNARSEQTGATVQRALGRHQRPDEPADQLNQAASDAADRAHQRPRA